VLNKLIPRWRRMSRVAGYVPPTDTGSLCLAVDSTHTVVGLFRFLVRRSGVELTARWTQRFGVWCRQLQTVL